MEDVQSSFDDREISIDMVGVTDLVYPIVVLDRANQKQQTTARISMSVDLPHHFKGTHMSRFIEVLEDHRGEITLFTLPSFVADLKSRLEAKRAHVHFRFPYFMARKAPVSGAESVMNYESEFIAEANGGTMDFVLGVSVPVTCVCPCSKAISDYGAHNQRGIVDIHVRFAPTDSDATGMVWIEELIEVAETSASAPVIPLLKREDERHVTMQAYDNPTFVEDVVRNVAAKLKADLRISWFEVKVVNMESIHNHSAFAKVSWKR